MGTVNSRGDLQYRCTQCDRAHGHSCSDLVWQLAERREKELGTESIFVSQWTQPCDCGAAIDIHFWVREYPLNCLDGEEVKITGGELLQNCRVGIKESIFVTHPRP
jgi:hypothetical protein